ncbi:MAG: IS3 family transposase, partial [Candidatus Obscuribacterales bacterium]|nr:IS3 family transposase [Candidatus Obscuribacterales bacterium]
AEAVEARFGKVEVLPDEIEWLSDNGAIYRSNKTREFAREIGLDPCTTPAYSPESNGLAEAFVKTFKRDYVRVHEIATAEEVLLQLRSMITTKVTRTRDLILMSPREFKLQQTG